ncbi:hypothetical protein ACO22_06458 [Paracoccidioides brasiliensis]|uniref:Uncharacterized protein n=1 Tax=Paracoccidioides brasiliensis TaxID=121759 RepID=A0A1D2J7G9_PARBR|nr:hypothetical protein ACO22_06458 [Paracoccidioides brasiliensis]
MVSQFPVSASSSDLLHAGGMSLSYIHVRHHPNTIMLIAAQTAQAKATQKLREGRAEGEVIARAWRPFSPLGSRAAFDFLVTPVLAFDLGEREACTTSCKGFPGVKDWYGAKKWQHPLIVTVITTHGELQSIFVHPDLASSYEL